MVVIAEEKTTPHATSTNNHVEASEGFETASEGEITDDDVDVNPQNQQPKQNDTAKDAEEEKVVDNKQAKSAIVNDENKKVDDQASTAVDSADADDDESKQRALAEANNLKLQGNDFYVKGEYEEALKQYEFALQIAPDIPSSVELRSICHSNRGMCFLKTAKYEDTVKECTKALQFNSTYLKALIRRGEAHEKLKQYVEALADMKKIVELDPSNDQARRAIRRLEPLAAEQQERMKEEMIGKLKEMGNSILGRFGMSIDNFKTVKDPNTGSYSVQFQR